MKTRLTNAPISTVCIVGGGTSGWMSAALLSKILGASYNITLVESEEIGTIGVGEATIPAIKAFNRLIDIDEAAFLRATQGTFKLGIEFVNWSHLGSRYFHAFGKVGKDLGWLRLHHYWLKMRSLDPRFEDFEAFCVNTMIARSNRFSHPRTDMPESPLSEIASAYHFDASLYARFLRQLSETRGVARVEGRIVDTRKKEDGFLNSVVLADGREITADLFVDCSGMRGLLIGNAMGVDYEDWSEWLLCDRAVAVPCASAAELLPYTRSTAHQAGWQWRIPLQHRIGNGHVYSSAHISDEAAAHILLENLDGEPLGEPRFVRFTPGRRRQSWSKNCVSIGLSAGFLEPLESTSIYLVQTGLQRLLSLFPRQGFDQADIDAYNGMTSSEYEDIRDFIIAHYKVTNRTDSDFWAYCGNMRVPDALSERFALFKTNGRYFRRGVELFLEESWVQLMIGQGMAPVSYDPMVDIHSEAEIAQYLSNVKTVIENCVTVLPTHAEYIARYCQAPAIQ